VFWPPARPSRQETVTEDLDVERQSRTPVRISRRSSPAGQAAPLVTISGALVVIVVVVYALSKNYEILAQGQLLSYTEGEVARVRFFDAFTVYIAREPVRLLDIVTTVAFAMLAGVALFVVALGIRKPATDARVKQLFLICLIGTMYLAIDESMAIHETLGHNMQFLADLPGVHRPDDLIFAAYLVPALIVLVAFRDIILSSRGALAFFAVGLTLFVVAGAFDVIGVGVDELVEPLSAACIIGGFTTIALDHVG
jgi:hypothetical protein